VAADARITDDGVAHLYARAVLAIARADDEIDPDEGVRLEERIAARIARPFSLDALLLADPLDPDDIADQLRILAGTPFRHIGVHPAELAEMIVVDSITVALAKGHLAEAEVREVLRFATALGCSRDQIRAMSDHLEPWMGTG
jgi:hypothetical protein